MVFGADRAIHDPRSGLSKGSHHRFQRYFEDTLAQSTTGVQLNFALEGEQSTIQGLNNLGNY